MTMTVADCAENPTAQVLKKSKAVPPPVQGEARIPLRSEPTQSDPKWILSMRTAARASGRMKLSKSAPPEDIEQRSVPLDLLRSVAPPFESLDL